MKPSDKRADDELEEQVLCAMAEAMAKGRHFDAVCLRVIEIVNELQLRDEGVISPRLQSKASH